MHAVGEVITGCGCHQLTQTPATAPVAICQPGWPGRSPGPDASIGPVFAEETEFEQPSFSPMPAKARPMTPLDAVFAVGCDLQRFDSATQTPIDRVGYS